MQREFACGSVAVRLDSTLKHQQDGALVSRGLIATTTDVISDMLLVDYNCETESVEDYYARGTTKCLRPMAFPRMQRIMSAARTIYVRSSHNCSIIN